MRSWSSIGSGRSVCRIRAKGRSGGTSYKRWCVCYRLIDPGSEWRLHRQWFEQSAMRDLLHTDCVGIDTLYRCLDKLLEHKTALFVHLRQRWHDLFGASFEVLLYDLTSTYFESSQPGPANSYLLITACSGSIQTDRCSKERLDAPWAT
jgi:hypothetical protein